MLNYNNKIKTILKPYCVDYIGFADLDCYQPELAELGGNIVKGYPYGISLGLVIPDAITTLKA